MALPAPTMKHTVHALVGLLAWSIISAVSAQTHFYEVEPNDTKAQATPAHGMSAGDVLHSSNFLGSSVPDIFEVRAAPLAPGIYRHRLVPMYNMPRVLGRTQTGGVIDPQSSVPVGAPTWNLTWYGFGQAEELFVDMHFAVFARGPDPFATLETVAIAPKPVSVPLAAGSALTVRTMPTVGTSDLDFALYDADFDALPLFARRGYLSGPPEGSAVVTEGVYHLAVTRGALQNHLAADPLDDFADDDVLDFRGAVVSGGGPEWQQSYEVELNGIGVLGVFTFSAEVHWYELTVGSGQATESFCAGDGTAGDCPCGAAPVGQGAGCRNSTGRGARLFAHGTLGSDTVRYAIEDVPPGTSVLVFAGLSAVAGSPSFAGNLCLGPGLVRLAVVPADTTGRCEVSSGATFVNAGFLTGTRVHAQAAYRDAVQPPGCNVNSTNGSTVTVRP